MAPEPTLVPFNTRSEADAENALVVPVCDMLSKDTVVPVPARKFIRFWVKVTLI